MFDPFGDFETNGYLRNINGTKDLDEIKHLEHFAFESGLLDALAFLQKERSLSYNSLKKVHEILFSSLYPWAGKDRQEVSPSLVISKGSKESEYHTVFALPGEIKQAVDYGLSIASNSEALKTKSGTVMGQLAFAHPFLDGNGRSLLLFHMELTHRAGFSIDWSKTEKKQYLQKLSKEIAEPRRHLDLYLSNLVVDKIPRTKWPDVIGEVKGLDGIDNDSRVFGRSNDPAVISSYAQDRYLYRSDLVADNNLLTNIDKLSGTGLSVSSNINIDSPGKSELKDTSKDYKP